VCRRLAGILDTLGIARPVIFGHSMGGSSPLLARHLGRGGLTAVDDGAVRSDDCCRLPRFPGDEVAAGAARLLRRRRNESEYLVFAAFRPVVPNADELARRIRNPLSGRPERGGLRRLDKSRN
jgi:pimeloyl-ACP methyl ester carboxylesterase